MQNILVVGSINMDLVTTTTKVPQMGETLFGTSFKQVAGGKGANQAVAIARLNAPVSMIGAVGDDLFGTSLLGGLQNDRVQCDAVQTTSHSASGIASITVCDGDNSIIVTPGANFALTPEHIVQQKALYEQASIVVHQLETPLATVAASLELAHSLGKTTILNPAPAQKLSAQILANCDYLIPNETELQELTGLPTTTDQEVEVAAHVLISQGVKQLIVTLGSRGALYISTTDTIKYEAHKVAAIDTTAAGDSFIGGFSVALSEGKSVSEALDFARSVSALTVSAEGAQTSLPTRNAVDTFIQERS